jgi:hypothetical protein
MIDSTVVKDAAEGAILLKSAIGAVLALVMFVAGRVHALRKKK